VSVRRSRVIGITVTDEMRSQIEKIVEACRDLRVSMSDVGFVILRTFLDEHPLDRAVQFVRDTVVRLRQDGML